MLHLLLALSILSPFKNYLLQQKCASPRVFALKDALVLSCEASQWRKNEIVGRSIKLFSSLVLQYPYASRYSIVLRKDEVPVIELEIEGKDILALLGKKLSAEDFARRIRAFNLRENLFLMVGVPIIPGEREVKSETPQVSGRFVLERLECKGNRIVMDYSYSFTGSGKVMLLFYRDGKVAKTAYLTMEGGGTGSKVFPLEGGTFEVEAFVWKGKWVKQWKREVECFDNTGAKK